MQQHELTYANGNIRYNHGKTTFNDIVTSGFYGCDGNVADGPKASEEYTGYYYLLVLASDENWVLQIAAPLEMVGYSNQLYIRGRQSGTWSAWSMNLNGGQNVKLTQDDGNTFPASNQDANTFIGVAGRVYHGENIINSPNQAVAIWWTIESYVVGGWGHQVATAWHSDERYYRRCNNGTFLPWRSL